MYHELDEKNQSYIRRHLSLLLNIFVGLVLPEEINRLDLFITTLSTNLPT
jgi:glucose-6-phosphate-specific signal transduction histidine kinase